jgi:hypothetical protein
MRMRLSRGEAGDNVAEATNATSSPTVMFEQTDDLRLLESSLLYKTFARQREEILRYKWIESEKAGSDIGFEKALLGWLIKQHTVENLAS